MGARRKVEELIRAGSVKINNKVVSSVATKVDPAADTVKVNNRIVKIEPKVYILLNKPPGYLTTVSDERGRKTIVDLVKVKERIFPVGRLDKNSRGLLILTNDGDLADKLLHPKHKIEKTYEVKISKALTEIQLERFRQGLNIDGRKTAPSEIQLVHSRLKTKDLALGYEVTLSEGRKRQIRRMFEVLGLKVLDLKRIQVGTLRIGRLKEGQWRYLTKREINNLLVG